MSYTGLGALTKQERDADAFYNNLHLISIALIPVPGIGSVFSVVLEVIGQITLLIASGGDLKKFSKAELRAVGAIAPFTKMVLSWIPGVPPAALTVVDAVGNICNDAGNDRKPSASDVAVVGVGIGAAAASSGNPDVAQAAGAVKAVSSTPGAQQAASMLPSSLTAKSKIPVKIKHNTGKTATIPTVSNKLSILNNKVAVIGIGIFAGLTAIWLGTSKKKRR